jgi:serine/threonine protein kinase
VAECAEILQQAANGLNAAHELGIIHRDLQPVNIFLAHGGGGRVVVKLINFAPVEPPGYGDDLESDGLLLGVPAYISPELVRGMRSDQLDLRLDLYSLGVVAYEMLTGRVPFQADTPMGCLVKHLNEPPPPFRAVAPGLSVPPQLEAVVMKALAKDREQRYASALEFAREFASAASAAAQPDELPPTKIAAPDYAQAERERHAKEQAEAKRRKRKRWRPNARLTSHRMGESRNPPRAGLGVCSPGTPEDWWPSWRSSTRFFGSVRGGCVVAMHCR